MKQRVKLDSSATDRILDEGVFSVVTAATKLNIRICGRTALRWCLSGIRGHVLESCKIGGMRMTSVPAIRRFIAATQEPNDA